jgi:hypothetical protein
MTRRDLNKDVRSVIAADKVLKHPRPVLAEILALRRSHDGENR